MSSKQKMSAEIFFSHQNETSTEFDEFWSWWVPRYDCIYVIYVYMHKDLHKNVPGNIIYNNPKLETI